MKRDGCLKAVALACAAVFLALSCGWTVGYVIARVAGRIA